MINSEAISQDLKDTPVESWTSFLIDAVHRKFASYTHGELKQWQQLLEQLPELSTKQLDLLNQVSVGSKDELLAAIGESGLESFTQQLKKLHPWRKGPFSLYGVEIDTEWRSDWKWDRLLPHIAPLRGRTILDVGCGNGYHCWRMVGQGARCVIGIDPSQKFLAQFAVIKKYVGEQPVHLLPLGVEDMPADMGRHGFDTVFSMGVLYHRKSPINHLLELKNLLAPNGELVLETLVVDGDENQVLLPKDRYAQMRNVWFLPSVKALERWLSRAGFTEIRTIDVNQTSNEEQRATDWMHFHSLSNYLDPADPNLTVEGLPAPKRAILIAKPKK